MKNRTGTQSKTGERVPVYSNEGLTLISCRSYLQFTAMRGFCLYLVGLLTVYSNWGFCLHLVGILSVYSNEGLILISCRFTYSYTYIVGPTYSLQQCGAHTYNL